jgi:hypothetical protein
MVELGLLLSGSMMMYHFQSKMFGPQQPQAQAAPSTIPINRGLNGGLNRKRRGMRPPSGDHNPLPTPANNQPPPSMMFQNLNGPGVGTPGVSTVPLQPIVFRPKNDRTPTIQEIVEPPEEERIVEPSEKKRKKRRKKETAPPTNNPADVQKEEEKTDKKVDEAAAAVPAYMMEEQTKKKKKKASPVALDLN